MYETEMVLLKLGCLAEQLIITSFILLLRYITLWAVTRRPGVFLLGESRNFMYELKCVSKINLWDDS